jgi:hypothetical protein
LRHAIAQLRQQAWGLNNIGDGAGVGAGHGIGLRIKNASSLFLLRKPLIANGF